MKTFSGRKLGRKTAHRLATLHALVEDLFQNEKIQTTVPKAKECVRMASKVMTSALPGDIHARRKVAQVVHDQDVRKKVFDVLVPRYQARKGGYTSLIPLGYRTGDAAPLAVVRLLP